MSEACVGLLRRSGGTAGCMGGAKDASAVSLGSMWFACPGLIHTFLVLHRSRPTICRGVPLGAGVMDRDYRVDQL